MHNPLLLQRANYAVLDASMSCCVCCQLLLRIRLITLLHESMFAKKKKEKEMMTVFLQRDHKVIRLFRTLVPLVNERKDKFGLILVLAASSAH